MSCDISSGRRAAGILGLLILVLGLVSGMAAHVAGQDTLTFTLDRTFGMALGNTLSGTFTLRGSGPDDIVSLTVYFNGEEVHSVTGNTISWQFNTGNYAPGSTNITLLGLDALGGTYQASRQVVILGEMTSNFIFIGIIAVVAVLAFVKYAPILKRRRKQ